VVEWVAHKGGEPVDPIARASHVAGDADGGAYFVGPMSTAGSSYDFAVTAYATDGTLRWSRQHDGLRRSADTPAGVAIGPAGQLVVAGTAATTIYRDFLTVAWDAAGNKLWARTRSSEPIFGRDAAYDVAVDSAGNIFVTGETGYHVSESDVMTVAYDAAGNELWARTRSLATGDRGDRIVVDATSQIVVAGVTDDGSGPFFLIAYDVAGAEQWVRQVALPGGVGMYVVDLLADAVGNTYVTGFTNGAGGNSDVVLASFDADGNQRWLVVTDGGSFEDDGLRAAAFDSSGNLYAVGTSRHEGRGRIFVLSLDTLGAERWRQVLDHPGEGYDSGSDVAVGQNGTVYVAGTRLNQSSASAVVLAMSSATGTVEWEHQVVSAPETDSQAVGVAVGSAGTIFVAGSRSVDEISGSDVLTLALSPSGGEIWSQGDLAALPADVPGTAFYSSPTTTMVLGADGSTYMTGQSDDGLTQDFLTVALDPSGDELWSARKDDPWGLDARASAIARHEPSGRTYVTGTARFGLGYLTMTVAYDAAGNELWTQTWSLAPQEASPCCIAAGADGTVYVAGTDTSLWGDIFVVAYGPDGSEQWVRTWDGAFEFDSAQSLAVSPTGSLHLLGITHKFGSMDFVTLTYDSDGVLLWERIRDGGTSGSDSARSLAVDAQGNVYVVGESEGPATTDFLAVKYDPTGAELWATRSESTWGVFAMPLAIQVDSAGNPVATGYSRTAITPPNYEFDRRIMTIAYDSSGATRWVRERPEIAGTDAGAQAVGVGTDGTVWVAGSAEAGTDLDLLVVGYSPGGFEQFHYTLAGAGASAAVDIHAPSIGGVVVTGYAESPSYDFLAIRLLDPVALFQDGFESGDTSVWSGAAP